MKSFDVHGTEQFVVECIRPDGKRVEFGRHASMKEASSQAARLCVVGCAAEARDTAVGGLKASERSLHGVQ